MGRTGETSGQQDLDERKIKPRANRKGRNRRRVHFKLRKWVKENTRRAPAQREVRTQVRAKLTFFFWMKLSRPYNNSIVIKKIKEK